MTPDDDDLGCARGVMNALPVALICWLAVACIGCPRFARAEDTPKASTVAPYCVLIAGNVADLVSTQQAFKRGAVESNPFMAGEGLGRISSRKAITAGLMIVLMRALETHGHPTAAKWIGYVDGSVMFAAALHNQQVRR
jgi:hypothetical protein